MGFFEGQVIRSVIRLLTDSGLRSVEVRQLAVEKLYFDLKLGDVVVNALVVIGKGGDEEPAFFGQATAERLRVFYLA